MMVGTLTFFLEIKCGCVSEVLDSNVPALTEKEELVKDVKVRGNLGCRDHEIVKIRILSGAPCKKQGCNSCLQKKNPRVKWFAQIGCRVCILGDVQNRLDTILRTCPSWYCFKQRGFTTWPWQFLSASATHQIPWYFTLTETITVNSSLQKLEFDGNHLSYLWKDGDKSYVDQLRDLCSLVYFELCHKELHNIPHQKLLDCPQHLSKLFINNNKLLCFLTGKHRLKPSNKAKTTEVWKSQNLQSFGLILWEVWSYFITWSFHS